MQINRLFEIVYLLLKKEIVTAAELAAHFEVSTRTIYRDIEALSQAGIPVYMRKGKGGGISLLPDFVLNKAVLTKEEQREILASMKAVRAVSFATGSDALPKLSSLLQSEQTDWIEVDFSSWGAYGTEAVDFERLRHAILEQYVVKFTYTSGKTERLERTVLPLKLVFKGAAWYLYGYCRLREDCRFFKLRRVRDLEVTQERFDLRAPERILTPDENMPKPLLPVKLKIAACMAFRVYDEMPQYTQDEHGDFLCELMLPDLPTICSYAASFGPYCVLLEPAAAADMLCEQMKKTLEQYRKYDTQMSYSTCYHKSIHKQKEGIIMNYEIVTLKEKTVLGITARTGNHDPAAQQTIGGLWQQFMGQGIAQSLANKANDYCIGLYSDYNFEDMTYAVTIGAEVTKAENPQLSCKTIPGGKYAKFIVKGDVVKDVSEAWGKIWEMPLERSYAADFEEYISNVDGVAEIHIYVSLR